jgi:hypothetical protein
MLADAGPTMGGPGMRPRMPVSNLTSHTCPRALACQGVACFAPKGSGATFTG